MKGDDLIEPFYRRPELVGGMILHQVPEFFDRIEFGAAGSKHNDAYTLRHLLVEVVFGVEARAVAITPLVFALPALMGTLPLLCPYPTQIRQ